MGKTGIEPPNFWLEDNRSTGDVVSRATKSASGGGWDGWVDHVWFDRLDMIVNIVSLSQDSSTILTPW